MGVVISRVQTANEMLGLQKEDLDAATERAIERQKNFALVKSESLHYSSSVWDS